MMLEVDYRTYAPLAMEVWITVFHQFCGTKDLDEAGGLKHVQNTSERYTHPLLIPVITMRKHKQVKFQYHHHGHQITYFSYIRIGLIRNRPDQEFKVFLP